jgi:galactarate dehydratase
VGQDGRVLDALQELTRLAATRETGERSRLMLDVASGRTLTWAERWKLHNALVLFNPAPIT